MRVKTLNIDATVTPYVLSRGIDVAIRKLVAALKQDMLENRASLSGYKIVLERTENVPKS